MFIDTFSSSPARRRWLRRLAIAAGVFALLTVLAWLAVPPIARGLLESRLSQRLGRKTTVEAVEFNPLQLRFTLRKLAIADPAGTAPLLALDELIADFSSASIWHRAPVLDALKLVRPAVSLARDRDGRYSVQDLIDAVFADSAGPPPRFSLNNIEIDEGRSHLTTARPDASIWSIGSESESRSCRRCPIKPTFGSLPASRGQSTAPTSRWGATPSRLPNGARPRSTLISTRCRSRITSRTYPLSHG
jgi:hypothetical protein